MQLRNSLQRYGAVAQALHWVMVVLILGMVVLGLYMEGLPRAEKMPGNTGYLLYQLHKSFGLTVLALAVLRLAWRIADPAPPVPAQHGGLVRLAAHLSHIALYGLIFAMPLSGWLYVSADPLSHGMVPTRFFDLFEVPNLLGADEATRDFFRGVHGVLYLVVLAVVAVHALAAFVHHFWFRDNVLLRMLPFARLRSDRNSDS
jgi:cytochrome b561